MEIYLFFANINFRRQTCLLLLDLIVQTDFALVLGLMLQLFDFVGAAPAAVLLDCC